MEVICINRASFGYNSAFTFADPLRINESCVDRYLWSLDRANKPNKGEVMERNTYRNVERDPSRDIAEILKDAHERAGADFMERLQEVFNNPPFTDNPNYLPPPPPSIWQRFKWKFMTWRFKLAMLAAFLILWRWPEHDDFECHAGPTKSCAWSYSRT